MSFAQDTMTFNIVSTAKFDVRDSINYTISLLILKVNSVIGLIRVITC